jgi:ribosomal protein L29
VATSPRATLPARTASSVSSAARYRAEISTLRRWSRIVLVFGTVASLGCVFGPLWVVRLGVIPALAAALVSGLLAWREIDLERRAHAAAMLAASRRHGAQLTEERRHNAVVVDTVSRRLQASSTLASSREATITRLYGEIRRLQGDVNGLRGANARLTRDRNFRDLTIGELRQTVARLEAELLAARTEDANGTEDVTPADLTPAHVTPADVTTEEGEVHAFPRRPLRDDTGREAGSAAGERRDLEFLVTQTVIAMPNYEDDRRFG